MVGTADIVARRAGRAAAFLVALLLALAGAVAADERPRAGLLWNRTGLPATFPLVVRSLPGRDYVVVLHDAETGAAALAAYFRGGDFFRVLVPPGTFRLRFDYGTRWLGEGAGFAPGPATGHYDLPRPLTFRVAGFNRRAGHVVDLRTIHGEGQQQAAVAPAGTCQRVAEALDGPPAPFHHPFVRRDRLLSRPCRSRPPARGTVQAPSPSGTVPPEASASRRCSSRNM